MTTIFKGITIYNKVLRYPILKKLNDLGDLISFYDGSNVEVEEGNLIATYKDYVSNNDFIATGTERPLSKTINNVPVVQFDGSGASNRQKLITSGSPFQSLTDCTVIMCFSLRNETNAFILLGSGDSVGFAYAGNDGSSSSAWRSFPYDNVYINKVLTTASTRNQAFDAITDKKRFDVVTIEGCDFTTWVEIAIGLYNGASNAFYPYMDLAALAIYNGQLSTTNREAAEQLLITEYQGLASPSYTFDEEITTVPDTIDGQNAANTGIDYDSYNNEFVVTEFVGSTKTRIGIWDAATRTKTLTIDLGTQITSAQGIAVKNTNGNPTYLFSGGKEFNRSGTLINNYVWPFVNSHSAIDYDSGFYFYLDNDSTLHRFTFEGGVIIVLESKTIYPRSVNYEGVSVKYGEYYILNEAGTIRIYDWNTNGLITEITSGITQWEGITELGDGTIAANNDTFFHGATPNGNVTRFFTKN